MNHPIRENLMIGNVQTTSITCHFYADEGRMGLSLRKYENIFMVENTTDGQVRKFPSISAGLAISEMHSWSYQEPNGTPICASDVNELSMKIQSAFQQGKNISIKFIIPPQNVPLSSIPQNVAIISQNQSQSVLYTKSTTYTCYGNECTNAMA